VGNRHRVCQQTRTMKAARTARLPAPGLNRFSLISGVGAAVSILGALEQGVLKPAGAGVGEAAAEDRDEILPAEGLRHEFPTAAGFGVSGEGGFDEGRRVELGFHGFHQVFSGVLGATLAGLFFFDFTDGVVDVAAGGFGKGVEEFLEAFGLAEFAGEDGMERHNKILPLMTLIARIFTDLVRL
jgi:hypothetical protein